MEDQAGECVVQGDPAQVSHTLESAPASSSMAIAKNPTGEALEKASKIRALEDEILQDSLNIVSAVLSFADITGPDHNELDIPKLWLDRCGGDREAAGRRMRIAKAAWQSKSLAPTAIDTAAKLSTSIIKARSTEKAGPRVLHMQVVQLSAPLPVFDIIDVESE